MTLIPLIIDQDGKTERAYDIYSRLLKDNIVFIGSEINDDVANLVIAQLLYLEAGKPEKEISLYINSPGGSITSGLAIYDTMQFISPDIVTICVGQAASMAAVLLAAGTPGNRIRENIHQILTKHTKLPMEKIQVDIERDFIMTPAQAKNYGIIDAIIENRDQSKK